MVKFFTRFTSITFCCLLGVVLFCQDVFAQVSINPFTKSYTQNFDGLPFSGTGTWVSMNESVTKLKATTTHKPDAWLWAAIVVFVVIWISTFVGTNDMNNWLLENALVFLALLFLIITYKKFKFSTLSYVLISIFLCLHVYGSKYTYAENPFGFWLKDILNLERNHYDRLIHFGFGLLLAYPIREMYINWLGYPPKLAWFYPIQTTLAVSAVYEIIEWGVADVFFTEQGMAYLGTQGDIWDAQKDTFLAFFGALLASTFISTLQKYTSSTKSAL